MKIINKEYYHLIKQLKHLPAHFLKLRNLSQYIHRFFLLYFYLFIIQLIKNKNIIRLKNIWHFKQKEHYKKWQKYNKLIFEKFYFQY